MRTRFKEVCFHVFLLCSFYIIIIISFQVGELNYIVAASSFKKPVGRDKLLVIFVVFGTCLLFEFCKLLTSL